MKEMITCYKSSRLLNKFSSSEPQEMYKEQFVEYAPRCKTAKSYGWKSEVLSATIYGRLHDTYTHF